ncbi:hypothetical protein [Salipaludibacillus daqingensis]|uniref:hypothetical protein n=1 Tax=Salipaludibacillus daqingensis TaxID=3041001 RepID=UPI0024742F79|nr:hypothetical protein [Salipaludibacillus daqingensis]
MLKKFAFALIVIPTSLLLLSCNDNTIDSNRNIVQDNDTVEVIFGDQQISLSATNYEELTEEAIRTFEEETSLYEPNRYDRKRWFIRYYIQKHEYNEDWSKQEIFTLSEERYEYEQAWKNYAYEEYSVEVNDEMIDSQAAYNLELYDNNLPPSVSGMSSGLDLSVEEFMMEFDRDYVERSLIWTELMPILLEEYGTEERQDGVYLGRLYEEEVMEYLEKNID